MTITRPFSHIALFALLGVSGWAGVAEAQLPPAAAPATAASTAKAGSSVAKPTPHVQVSSRHVPPKSATSTAEVDKNHLGERYAPQQRGLIDQYQNAVTPPPMDSGR
jgi:hypothetical protein